MAGRDILREKIKILVLVGPTASGKTALSVKLAKALHGEIISADSMQIYKGMDIATAKPSIEEREGIPHYLMDFLEPSENYSVAHFVDDAKRVSQDIAYRGKLPIVAGGTGLYVDSLINGISFSEGDTDFEYRASLLKRLEEEGIDKLLFELKAIDPDAFEKLAPQRNPKRIIRALEVFHTTGITFSEQNRISREVPSEFNEVIIGLNFRDREKLYDRINRRVDLMMDMGLRFEAEKYFSAVLSVTSSQDIGYKVLKPYPDGLKSLDDCVETLKQSTRRYAKRQLTWFRRNENIKWFYVDDYENEEKLFDDVIKYLVLEGFEINEA